MRLFLQKDGQQHEIKPESTVLLPTCSTKVSGSTLAVSADIDSLFDAYKSKKFVTSINEIQAGNYGDFYIEGSECVSWTNTDAVIEDPAYQNVINGAILVADMCPSCVKCESIYRLQYEFENLKMWINTLKDVNLYDADDTQSRHENLAALRVTGSSSSCGIYPADDSLIKGTQLFKEYVTMLHMWNYVVSTNNYSNLIQLAPEDTAGFVVQTKHAVTSCDGEVKVACQIEVSRYNTGASEPSDYSALSIYIPEESKQFCYGPIDVDNKGFVPVAGSSVTVVTGSPVTHKTLQSTPTPYMVNKAGTFMMEAKFLPFIPSITKVGDTQLTPTNWNTITGSTHTTPSGKIEAAYDVDTTVGSPIANPDKATYLNSCIAPSTAVDLSMVWNIRIVWYLWESVAGTCTIANATKTEEQTYLYKCNAVAVPCGSDLSWHSEVQPDPTPES